MNLYTCGHTDDRVVITINIVDIPYFEEWKKKRRTLCWDCYKRNNKGEKLR